MSAAQAGESVHHKGGEREEDAAHRAAAYRRHEGHRLVNVAHRVVAWGRCSVMPPIQPGPGPNTRRTPGWFGRCAGGRLLFLDKEDVRLVGTRECRTGRAAVSIEFLVTTLIVVATPGTGVIYTVAAGLSRGARASVVAAVGCTLGIIPHMVAAITGLAALLHTSALAFQTLKYLGVAYLLYLAWTTLQEKGALAVENDNASRSALKVIISGILINILNPKLTIFFFAFLPQFVSTEAPHAVLRMLELSAVFMLVTFIVFAAYGVFAAAVRNHVISRPQVMTWMRRVFAGSFVALGARLALTDR